MFIVYDLFFIVFSLIYLPFLLVKQKWHPHFGMRFGIFNPEIRRILPKGQQIWIHAVSVGEVLSMAGLIRYLRKEFPQSPIVISTVTQTGYQMAHSIIQNDGLVIYAPLDLSVIVRRVVSLINPRIYIAAETEIWPNLFTALKQKGVPLVQINGRISQRSFKGYRLVKFLTSRILSCVDIFCMQTKTDARRIISLGAEPDKVKVVGNIKFDDLSTPAPLNRAQLGLDHSDILLVAGSTHPGEEEIVLRSVQAALKENPALRLVLAPRHIERVNEIDDLINQFGFAVRKFSQFNSQPVDAQQVMLVDTIGHLRSIYGLADLVFVGKSLTAKGGHNIIEPAYFAKPILVGPHMENFKDITELFLLHEAIVQVDDEEDFLKKMNELIRDPKKREILGVKARETVEENRGAMKKTKEVIAELIKKSQKIK